MATKPAVGLVAVAGRRRATLEMAQRLEREGFTGLYCPSPGDGLALCQSLALSTREIPFGTSIGNMVPTCIDDDRAAAAAVMRRTLASYVRLPNYQNYWIEAGYEDEMLAIRAALARGETQRVPELLSDRWLRDVTLFGSVKDVRDGVEAWLATGVRTLIVVASSTRGGQMVALDELIQAFR